MSSSTDSPSHDLFDAEELIRTIAKLAKISGLTCTARFRPVDGGLVEIVEIICKDDE